MSSTVQLIVASAGFLIVIVGAWRSWRIRRRLPDPRVPSLAATLAMALMSVGVGMSLLPMIRTDAWSMIDWFEGFCFVAVVFITGGQFGQAFEMSRQRKSASGEAQRVGTGFSPR